ncbi:MAG TPA: sugar-transporting ATPase [Planctomycetes bacterium]|nr:sugar-transporting ATPase [Planctomycetota bacterium]
MATGRFAAARSRLFNDYGMLLGLLVLCAFFTAATWEEYAPSGAAAGRDAAAAVVRAHGAAASVLIVTGGGDESAAFAAACKEALEAGGATVLRVAAGDPIAVRPVLEEIARGATKIDAIVATADVAAWSLFDNLGAKFPALAGVPVVTPPKHSWPTFLTMRNLRNIIDQIVIIAVLAIGMTMVIITGGIDLSVGRLIALSGVVTTLLIRDHAGGYDAQPFGMVLCCAGGIAVCAGVGAFSGVMVTFCRIPPFIVTLAMMLVAEGAAYLLSHGQSVYQVPPTFAWLDRGSLVGDIPNAVVLLAVLYAIAHVVMTRTTFGRYIYAVGGNSEAARLSGVRVWSVLLAVYTLCGAFAGLGGVITASQIISGDPKAGNMYELYTIAAVVVGGTSLAGGEGKILGTLIGAFIIAVIGNGMVLTGVESYTQKIVVGLVILGAVLLDALKKRGFGRGVGRSFLPAPRS